MRIDELITESGLFENVNTGALLTRTFICLGIIILGIVAGKLINIGLRKIITKADLEKKVKKDIIDLFLILIRWSVYIVFFIIGLNYLNISNLTSKITNVLIIIPTFIGALILIFVGFSIAYFLKKVILSTEINGVKIISELVFYFVIYICGVYAIKTALISLGEQLTNYLIMILTGISAMAGAYLIIKKYYK